MMPVEPIVAIAVLPLLHIPPVVASLKVAVPPPAHANGVPLISDGTDTTFTVVVVDAVPQLIYLE